MNTIYKKIIVISSLILCFQLAEANDSDQVNCNKPFKIVVLGSSTTFGTGASTYDSSWVARFTRYVKGKHALSEVYNFGIPGFTTYEALCPTGLTPPSGRPQPSNEYNITAALNVNPDVIIINLPTNDAANNFTVSEQKINYERAINLATAANIPVWVTTTQPRNNMSTAQMSNLLEMRDWITSRFGAKSVDFWTTLANPNGTIATAYNVDGTHVNNRGHEIFYNRIKAESILDSLCYRANAVLVARAGMDTSMVLPVQTYTLNGSGSTGPFPILSYQWTKLSGPSAAIINTPNQVQSSISNLIEGRYKFQLTVTDSSGSIAKSTIQLIISSRILIDFGPSATLSPDNNNNFWNIVPIAQNGRQLQNAITSNGAITNISLNVLQRIDGTFNIDGPGTNTGNNIGVVGDYPNDATTDFAFAEPSTGNGKWQFEGLDMYKEYTFKFWGTRSVSDDRIIQIKRSDETGWQEYNAAENYLYDNAAVFTVSGKTSISFDIKVKDGSAFGYISVVDIKRTTASDIPNIPPVANAGNDVDVVLPNNSIILDGSQSHDEDGEIVSYQWTKISGPDNFLILQSDQPTTTIQQLEQGIYRFELAVKDNNNIFSRDTVMIIVSDRILIDLGNTLTTSPDQYGHYWNNMLSVQNGNTLNNIVTTQNANTTLALNVVERIDGSFNPGGPGTNSGNTIGEVGDYPNSATTDFAFAEPSTQNGKWNIIGLEKDKKYTVKFWGTRSVEDDRIIEIRLTGENTWKSYNAANNTNYQQAASFEIKGKTEQSFDIRVKDGSAFGYISVIDIKVTKPEIILCKPYTPQVIISADVPVSICQGSTINFSAVLISGNNPAHTFQWTKNSVNIPGATTANFSTNSLAHNDTIRCVVKNEDSCSLSKQAISNPLTIQLKLPTSSNTVVSTCNQYIWNGKSYTVSGTYSISGLVNKAGCDSTASLNLTIKNSSSSTLTISACSYYIWNGTTYVNSGTYSKTGMKNKEGCDSTAFLNLTIQKLTTPGAISGPINACQYMVSTYNPTGILVTYTINKLVGTTTYNWSVPANSSIISRPGVAGTVNDTIIIVKFNSNFVSGNIAVAAVNSCGTSTSSSLYISKTVPATPAAIVGDVNACSYITSGNEATYKISKVPGAVDYDWTITGTGASIISHPAGEGINDSIITVRFANNFTQGTLLVKSVGNCGTNSSGRSLQIQKLPLSNPSLSGSTSVCALATATYTAFVTGATSYSWTIPLGASFIGSSNTATVTVKFPLTHLISNVSVKANSVCGTSTATTLTVYNCILGLGKSNSTANRVGMESTNLGADSTNTQKAIEFYSIATKGFIFPNPSNGNFQIRLESASKNTPVKIEIFTSAGKLVYSQMARQQQVQINLYQKLNSGVYIVKTTNNGVSQTQKLVVGL